MFVEQPRASPGSANQCKVGKNICRKDVTNVGGAGEGKWWGRCGSLVTFGRVWSLVWGCGHQCGGVVICVELWSLVWACGHLCGVWSLVWRSGHPFRSLVICVRVCGHLCGGVDLWKAGVDQYHYHIPTHCIVTEIAILHVTLLHSR